MRSTDPRSFASALHDRKEHRTQPEIESSRFAIARTTSRLSATGHSVPARSLKAHAVEQARPSCELLDVESDLACGDLDELVVEAQALDDRAASGANRKDENPELFLHRRIREGELAEDPS